MDTVQKIQLKQSEMKVRLNAMLDTSAEDRSETFADDLSKLSKEVKGLEVELQAAILAQPEPEPAEVRTEDKPSETAEDRELLELRAEVDFGRYVQAAMTGNGIVGGPEAELNDHLDLESNMFPLDLLVRSDVPEDLEARAKRDGDASAMQRTWVDRVFADSAAMRVGISFESVGAGVATFPVTTAGGGGVQRGREQAVAESTYTFAVTELKPTRSSVRAVYSIEDNARLPGMASAILRDMRMGLTEAVDRAIFKGDAGADENTADITGLQTAANVGEVTLTQSNKVKADETLKSFLSFVDGRYAIGMSDLRIVAAQGANTLWHSTIHNSAAENQTIARFLMAAGLMWTVRGEIASGSGNNAFGAFIGLGRGIRGAGVAPVWNRGILTTDPYSSAAKGEVNLTLHWLWNFGLPRPANFKRLKFAT